MSSEPRPSFDNPDNAQGNNVHENLADTGKSDILRMVAEAEGVRDAVKNASASHNSRTRSYKPSRSIASLAKSLQRSLDDSHPHHGSEVQALDVNVVDRSLEVGDAYSYTTSVVGGVAPYTFSVAFGSLPTGMTLNTSTGVISGTPSVAGSSSFSIQAKDSRGDIAFDVATYTATVTGLAIFPVSPVTVTDGVLHSQTIATASSGTSPYTFTLQSGSLPAGLSLSTTGTLSGTTTAVGTYPIVVRVTDAALDFVDSSTITIDVIAVTGIFDNTFDATFA